MQTILMKYLSRLLNLQKNKFQVDTAQFATDKQTSFKSLECWHLQALELLIFIPMK